MGAKGHGVRYRMTSAQLRAVFEKTDGHCHFCGDPVVFSRRGWRSGSMRGYWEVDHIIQRGKGGVKTADNCLPACTSCNRLRWHRKGAALRNLLRLGLIAYREVRHDGQLGRSLRENLRKRLAINAARRIGRQ